MIQGINDSKKSFIIWMAVFVVIFGGLSIGLTVLNNSYPAAEQATAQQMSIIYAVSFFLGCFPIGWATKRKITTWYAHIPTEDIQVFETNLVVAIWRLGKCWFLLLFDVALLCLYIAFAAVAGPIMTLYTLITGIVFICKKKI